MIFPSNKTIKNMNKSFEEIKETEKLNKRLLTALGIALGFSFLIIFIEIIKIF